VPFIVDARWSRHLSDDPAVRVGIRAVGALSYGLALPGSYVTSELHPLVSLSLLLLSLGAQCALAWLFGKTAALPDEGPVGAARPLFRVRWLIPAALFIAIVAAAMVLFVRRQDNKPVAVKPEPKWLYGRWGMVAPPTEPCLGAILTIKGGRRAPDELWLAMNFPDEEPVILTVRDSDENRVVTEIQTFIRGTGSGDRSVGIFENGVRQNTLVECGQ
jgi:hypothetical protein